MKPSYIFILIFLVSACRKEDNIVRLRFTDQERQWFIYQPGQKMVYKDNVGDSLVFTVTKVEHNYNTPEYSDTSFSKVVALNESYFVKMESSNDSLLIYFFKESIYGGNLQKMRQTIRWLSFKSQFLELSAIGNGSAFFTKTVNGFSYLKVTEALPVSTSVYPTTKFVKAYYDQDLGFIEFIDVNGLSWKRQ